MVTPIFFDDETKRALLQTERGLVAFAATADESSKTLIRLTRWLIAFTIALVVLTAAVVVLTIVVLVTA